MLSLLNYVFYSKIYTYGRPKPTTTDRPEITTCPPTKDPSQVTRGKLIFVFSLYYCLCKIELIRNVMLY